MTRRTTYVAPELPGVDPVVQAAIARTVIAWAVSVILIAAGVLLGVLIGVVL
ncbi:hypothetical protein FB562_2229 [Homoserinimonas aerilata]|uniref:Uncharacterized protein n=1 Tax=Homoserinimonas aerilata TaxID=1162970 RepID=A0A542YF36_9MICO|nr:hypothetical protein [Homoserinimonas aerilata]TQL46705.1 hypothetical protein FB562_2229 [Homoserinimonas aerilata]